MAETVEASATSPGDPTPGAEASPSFAVGDQVSVFEQASGPDATTLSNRRSACAGHCPALCCSSTRRW